jgi:hypothetical protein
MVLMMRLSVGIGESCGGCDGRDDRDWEAAGI